MSKYYCVVNERGGQFVFRFYFGGEAVGNAIWFSTLEDAVSYYMNSSMKQYDLRVNFKGKEKNVIKTDTFIRKPLVVEGIQVSSNNMNEIAEWCGGEVNFTPSKRSFIKLHLKPSPMTRQNMAFAGDWVLKSDMGFKIYSKRAFERTFDSHII